MEDYCESKAASPARDYAVRHTVYITQSLLRHTSVVVEVSLLHGPCGENKADVRTGNRLCS
jgi:hypothetical protein